jgi:oligopeptidase B
MSKKSIPVAKIIPKSLEKHNETRIDNYFWK